MFNMKLARTRERELQQVLCCYGSQYKKSGDSSHALIMQFQSGFKSV